MTIREPIVELLTATKYLVPVLVFVLGCGTDAEDPDPVSCGPGTVLDPVMNECVPDDTDSGWEDDDSGGDGSGDEEAMYCICAAEVSACISRTGTGSTVEEACNDALSVCEAYLDQGGCLESSVCQVDADTPPTCV